MLRPQDLLVALHIAIEGERKRYADIAHDLRISPSVAHRAATRATRAHLLTASGQPHHHNLREFLVHGARFAFFAAIGGPTRGVATGAAAPVLCDRLTSARPWVWPASTGKIRGESLEPLYPTVPEFAADHPQLYVILAALDLLRVGSAREREVAIEVIDDVLLPGG